METIDQGFAIRRNGSCIRGLEVDCGATRAPYRGCCPTGFACPASYNIDCCPPGRNCTMALLEAQPIRCANATWDLFDNGGYFCCEHGHVGYDRGMANGCARPGAQLEDGDRILPTIRAGVVASPTSSAQTSSLPTSTASRSSPAASATLGALAGSASPPPSGSSSTNVGAIAGGVVGGIVGLALVGFLVWFLLRRKQKNNTKIPAQTYEADAQGLPPGYSPATKYRMDGQPQVHEVDGSTYASELPSNQHPAELPAR